MFPSMAQSPSVPQTGYGNFSSPDPLATSTDNPPAGSSPSKKRNIVRHKHSSSQSSRASNTFSQQFNLPSRTVADQTISPWNIRVTVEAEPEAGADHDIHTVTRTTRIPLKDTSPILSHDTKLMRSTSKAGSPSRMTTAARRKQSVTDLDIVVLGDDADEDDWAVKKASPRKKRTAARNRHESSSCREAGKKPFTDNHTDTIQQSRSPDLGGIDVNRVSLRQRAESSKRELFDLPLPSTEDPIAGGKGGRQASTNSTRSYPTPSPTPSEQEDGVDAFDTIMESEGFTMIDLESIASVRQLGSTPALKAPASGKDIPIPHGGPIPALDVTTGDPPYPKLPSFFSTAIENGARIQDSITSSPPVYVRQTRPASTHSQLSSQPFEEIALKNCSSPRLPSSPGASSIKIITSNSIETLKAAKNVKGPLEPTFLKAVRQRSSKEDRTHTGSNCDELFEGYDSRTQREMRAGLRFGEELAKRQPRFTDNGNSTDRESHTQARSDPDRRVTDHNVPDSLTARPEGDRCVSTELESKNRPHSVIPIADASYGSDATDLSLSARREQQWQLERDEVIKAIQEASPSKVIVVDSDDEDEDEVTRARVVDTVTEDEGGDIWLAEAKDSSPDSRATVETSRACHQSDEVLEKLHRRPIPSPWKRGEQISGNDSTIMTTGEGESAISGMFWKQAHDDELRFGAKHLKTMRRDLKNDAPFSSKNSGSFDLERMMSTPKRIQMPTNMKEKLDLSPQSVESRDSSNSKISHVDQRLSPIQLQVDSSRSQATTVPASQSPRESIEQQVTPTPEEVRRPPTPKSALKHTRPSLISIESGTSNSDLYARVPKQVNWARRSTLVNEEWLESSRSVNTENLSVFSDVSQQDGSSDVLDELQSDWQATSKQVSSSPLSLPATKSDRAKHHARPINKLPSYLRHPSYPSDPTRSTSSPMKVSGDFTNAHFRTLHIIYRKAQRPRFHGPTLDELRPQIRKLVTGKWILDVDEERAGLGGFRFKVGELEGRVLERFCREAELGYLEDNVKLSTITSDGGIWGGSRGCDHGKGAVAWAWNCEQLATWLGNIVIGEVVREEEGRSIQQ